MDTTTDDKILELSKVIHKMVEDYENESGEKLLIRAIPISQLNARDQEYYKESPRIQLVRVY